MLRLLLCAAFAAVAAATSSANLVARTLVYFVNIGEDVDVRLQGFNIPRLGSRHVRFTLTDLPEDGSLYLPSHNYCKYGGTTPSRSRRGTQVTGPVDATCDNPQVIYSRSASKVLKPGEIARFHYVARSTKHPGAKSCKGVVHFVNAADPALAVSTFATDNDGWRVNQGNGRASDAAGWDRYSIGRHNRYVWASDTAPDLDAGGTDKALWNFLAPDKFLGSGVAGGMAGAYGGHLRFLLSSASGDFTQLNSGHDGKSGSLPVVRLECTKCRNEASTGRTDRGIRLIFPHSALKEAFKGDALDVGIHLNEASGWLKDPENTNNPWVPPTQNEFVQVLKRFDALYVLGDYTTHYESVLLDNVRLEPRKDGQASQGVLPDLSHNFMHFEDANC